MLDAAEQKSGAARAAALTALARQVDGDASGAKDAARVRRCRAVVYKVAGPLKTG